MEYDVNLIPLDKAIPRSSGFLRPLCDSCCSPDCTNPIEEKSVSIAGVVMKMKLYVINETAYRQVVACNGFLAEDDNNS